MVGICSSPTHAHGHRDLRFNVIQTANIVLPSVNVIPIVSKAKSMGSMMSRDSTDNTDVGARITAASSALSALSKCVFKSRGISLVYVVLVLSILLYGSECWCLAAKLWRKLRTFHRACTMAMCRINRPSLAHVEVQDHSNERATEAWAEEPARMKEHRLQHKLLTAWC